MEPNQKSTTADSPTQTNEQVANNATAPNIAQTAPESQITAIGDLIQPGYSSSKSSDEITSRSYYQHPVALLLIFFFVVMPLISYGYTFFRYKSISSKQRSLNTSIVQNQYSYTNQTIPPPPSAPKYVSLESFQIATITWAEKFPVDTTTLRDNSYKVFYFNRQDSKNSQKTAVTDMPFLRFNFNDEDKYKIPAQQLAVYWIGKKKVQVATNYIITVDAGGSNARLLIDKKIVSENSKSQDVLVNLLPGDHIIEIEFMSAVGSPQLNFAIVTEEESKSRTLFSESDVFKFGAPVWYAGVYRPEQQYIDVILPEDKGSTTLILSSYETTKWRVKQAKGTNIVSVLATSYEKNSTVDGVLPGTVVAYSTKYIATTSLYPICTFGYSRCDEAENYRSLYDAYGNLPHGGYLATFTGSNASSTMVLPGRILEIGERAKLDAYAAKVRSDWQIDQEKRKIIH